MLALPKRLLPQDFYLQLTDQVAKQLLGKILARQFPNRGAQYFMIVETEAYLGVEDPACHSYKNKKTPRTQWMYLPGGHTYIYLIYGLHHCLNIVTQPAGIPEAVLIRAIAPISLSDEHSCYLSNSTSEKPQKIVTNGPGKLTKHLQITRDLNGIPVWDGQQPLYILEGASPPEALIGTSPRIGVEYAGKAARWPLRFFIKNSPFVSQPSSFHQKQKNFGNKKGPAQFHRGPL
ncbi:MAG: DNA-3-methyladenine glycosylase [Bdellovibrionaceae bacterium]|nr:DNA-3-methyladenine glycosylase [Pseudobdellovibrionaceae bacterium]MDW8189872.1 DNA-3-methyladenine glycosylase [Pseudobdellovibrionaceae bacterium]